MSLGPNRKSFFTRQFTLPLQECKILPLGGAVVVPSTEDAPMRAPTAQEAALMAQHALHVPDRTKKVRVDLSVLEKRNLCMVMDYVAENKKGNGKKRMGVR